MISHFTEKLSSFSGLQCEIALTGELSGNEPARVVMVIPVRREEGELCWVSLISLR